MPVTFTGRTVRCLLVSSTKSRGSTSLVYDDSRRHARLRCSNYLLPDTVEFSGGVSDVDEYLCFGTIVIFTCVNSCWDDAEAEQGSVTPRSEYTLVQEEAVAGRGGKR